MQFTSQLPVGLAWVKVGEGGSSAPHTALFPGLDTIKADFEEGTAG